MEHHDHGEDRSGQIVIVGAIMTASICVFVALRFWTRYVMVQQLGADDWYIGVATISSIAMNTLMILSTKYGAGRHVYDINPAIIVTGLKYNYITQVFTPLSLLMVKVSISMFLLRLASTQTYRRIIMGFIVFITVYSCATIALIIFQCLPVSAAFQAIEGAKCMSNNFRLGFAYAFAIVTILSDFFLVILPVFMLWNTQIPRRQRVMICGILGVGTFASTASIVKSLYLVNYAQSEDFLWTTTDICCWAMVEIDVGIIGASMPALKPLFKRVMEKTLYSKYGMRSRSRSNSRTGHHMATLKSTTGGISNDIRAGRPRHVGTLQDNESEEGIIGISKHTDVRVEIETLSQHSTELAMGNMQSGEKERKMSTGGLVQGV